MTLFTDLVKVLTAFYSTGASAHTVAELVLLVFDVQTEINQALAADLSAGMSLSDFVRSLANIWIPVWAQPPRIAIPVMVGHLILGMFLLALLPAHVLEELGLE